MAEALGLACSVVAVLELAQAVASKTYKYARGVKNAPAELLSLKAELSSLTGVLCLLKDGIGHSEDDSLEKSRSATTSAPYVPEAALKFCESTLQELMKLLAKGGTEGARRFLWPFREGELKDLLAKLERAKSLLELAMTADQSIVVKEIEALSLDIQKTTSATLEAVLGVQEEQKSWREEMQQNHIDESNREAIQWLFNRVDHEVNHREACKVRQAGTGRWFVDGNRYKELWLHGDEYDRLLWLQGIPGAGKTVLMSTIIEETMDQNFEGKVGIAYFYLSFRNTEKQDACNMLSSLLAQLCEQREQFPAAVTSLREKYKARPGRPHAPELVMTLSAVCKEFDKVFIFLDGLDECTEEEDMEAMLEAVGEITAIENTRHLYTSRKYPVIEEQLVDNLDYFPIWIQSNEVDEDIRRFVEENLGKISILKRQKEAQEQVSSRLVKGANGMFRWVECQMQLLKKCRTVKQIMAEMERLPGSLAETYDRMLAQGTQHDEGGRLLRRALKWIILAKGSMKAHELAEAITVEIGSKKLDPSARLGDPEDTDHASEMKRVIEDICGGFVAITRQRSSQHWQESRRAYDERRRPWVVDIAHFSVQEYLMSKKGSEERFHIDGVPGHEDLSRVLATYLQWEDLAACKYLVPDLGKVLKQKFPLYEYAAEKCFKHIHDAGIADKASEILPSFFQVEVSDAFYTWIRFRYFERDRADIPHEPGTSLILAASEGFMVAARSLLDNGAPVNGPAFAEGIDLNLSSDDEESDTDDQDEPGDQPVPPETSPAKPSIDYRYLNDFFSTTPLLAALMKGKLEMATMLLERGANPNLGRATLCAAADLESKDLDYPEDQKAPLVDDILQRLLDKGADVNMRNRPDCTPIICSVQYKTWEVDMKFRRLLANGADVNLLDCKNRTPLHYLSKHPNTSAKTAKLLVDHGVDLDIIDYNGMTAAHCACDETNLEIARFLLECDTEKKTPLATPEGVTALHSAVRAAYCTLGDGIDDVETRITGLIDLLLQRGLDINSRTADGKTPLHEVADRWQSFSAAVIQKLIDCGADVSLKNNRGQSALFLAGRKGSLEVFKNLHRAAGAGAGLDPPWDRKLFKELITSNKDAEEIESFLEIIFKNIKAKVLINQHKLKTPLQFFGRNRQSRNDPALVRVIRNYGGRWYGDRRPANSAEREVGKLLRYLISKGADIEARDIRGMTALHAAVNSKITAPIPPIAILLEEGADLFARDNNGWTVLHHAVASQDHELIVYLLAKGGSLLLNVKDYKQRAALYLASSGMNCILSVEPSFLRETLRVKASLLKAEPAINKYDVDMLGRPARIWFDVFSSNKVGPARDRIVAMNSIRRLFLEVMPNEPQRCHPRLFHIIGICLLHLNLDTLAAKVLAKDILPCAFRFNYEHLIGGGSDKSDNEWSYRREVDCESVKIRVCKVCDDKMYCVFCWEDNRERKFCQFCNAAQNKSRTCEEHLQTFDACSSEEFDHPYWELEIYRKDAMLDDDGWLRDLIMSWEKDGLLSPEGSS